MADHKLYLSYKCGEISLTDRTTEELQQIYNSSIILEKDGAYNFVINLYTLYNYRFTEKDFFHARITPEPAHPQAAYSRPPLR